MTLLLFCLWFWSVQGYYMEYTQLFLRELFCETLSWWSCDNFSVSDGLIVGMVELIGALHVPFYPGDHDMPRHYV